MANIVEILLRTNGSRQTKQALGSVTSEMGSMRKMVGSLGLALGAYGLTRAFVKFTAESVKTAARVQEMQLVVGMLGERAGYTNEQIDASIEAITELGIRTDVAQQLTSQFLRYELDLADAVDLARIAQDAAVLSMQDSSDALNQIIYGVTTFNVRVLRTAGLNVQMGQSFDDLAASLGKASEDLTNTERIQAALNAVQIEGIRIAGAYETAMEAPGKQLRSMERHVFELKSTIGEELLPAFGDAVAVTTEWLKMLKKSAEEGWLKELLEDAGDFAETVAGGIKDITEAIEGQYDVQAARETAIRLLKAEAGAVDETGEAYARLREETADWLATATYERGERESILEGSARLQRMLISLVRLPGEALEEVEAKAQSIEELTRILKDYDGNMGLLQETLVSLTGTYEEYATAVGALAGPNRAHITGLQLTTIEWLELKDAVGDYMDMFIRVQQIEDRARTRRAEMRREAGSDPRRLWEPTPEAIPLPGEAIEIFVNFQTNLAEVMQEQQDALDALRNEWLADEIRERESYQADLAAAAEDFYSDQAEALEDFHQRESEIEADYYRDRMRFAEDHSLEMAQLEEDHQARLRYLREDYDYSQEDAIAARDAIAFIRNQRRYERDRQRLEEGHQTETQRRDEDFARRMADMEADFQEERTARLAHLEQRQAEAAAAYQEEQADLAAAHAERIADLEEQYVLEEGLLKAKHKKEEKTLKDKFKKELIAYADQAGELEGILGEWHAREKEMVGTQLESHMGAFEDWLLAIGEGIDGLPVGGDGGGVDGPSGAPDTWPDGRYVGEMREWGGYVYIWNGSYWSRGTAVPGYQSGAWEIQQDQIAQLHAGEMVVPSGPAKAIRAKGVPQYDDGAWNIRHDQIAQLHTGEMIVPAGLAHVMRSDGPPEYQSGAWEIREDQIAKLHAGEMVVPSAPAEAMRANNLAAMAANPPGGAAASHETAVSYQQALTFPGIDGATAQEVAALVRPQTIELLQQYARGY